DAVDKMARRWTHCREEAESTVDMHPRAVLRRQARDLPQRVEVARVDVARGGDDERRLAAEAAQLPLQSRQVEPAGCVAREDARRLAADPQHAQGLDRARVQVAARENRNRRQTAESGAVDVDPVLQAPP